MRGEALKKLVERAVAQAVNSFSDPHASVRVGRATVKGMVDAITDEVLAALEDSPSLDKLVHEATTRLTPGLLHQLTATVVRVDDHVDVTEMELVPKLEFRYQAFIKGEWRSLSEEEFQRVARGEPLDAQPAFEPWPLDNPPGAFFTGQWAGLPDINVRRETCEGGITGTQDVTIKRIELEDDGSVTAVVHWDDTADTLRRVSAVLAMQAFGFKWIDNRWQGPATKKLQIAEGDATVIGPVHVVDSILTLVDKGVRYNAREDLYDQLAVALGTDAMDSHDARIDTARKGRRAINTLHQMGYWYVDHTIGWARRP